MIDIEDVSIRYGSTEVISNLNLHVGEGEFVSLLGSSGCGKSTLLRAVGGFVPVHQGRISVGGRDITRLPPEERGLGFVFQSYALFPHLTVAKNVGFGLRVRGLGRAQREQRTERALEITGLSAFADKVPANLSGGQQQRVAIARVLATEPSVILMDEPLSNLDAILRDTLRSEISRLHRELGTTTLYVTHDQQEALSLSDRVAVMRDGALQRIGTPGEVYHDPRNEFVCNFVGSANRLGLAARGALGLQQHGPDVFVRPERIQLGTDHLPHRTTGTVLETTFLGVTTEVLVQLCDQTVRVLNTSTLSGPPLVGAEVVCGFTADDVMAVTS